MEYIRILTYHFQGTNVVDPTVHLPLWDYVYHPCMVILGVVDSRVYHIILVVYVYRCYGQNMVYGVWSSVL